MWDLPLRVFHWSFAALIIAAFVTGKNNQMELHFWFAYAAAMLLIFRIVWGFIGTRTARFAQFVKGPSAVLAYLKVKNHGVDYGHNPLGAWSIVAILLLVAVQLILGLFSSDDIFVTGPWNHFISGDLSSILTRLHKRIGSVLIPLWFIAHMAAIIIHRRRGHRLVPAMVTGGATPIDQAPLNDSKASRIKALVVLLLACVLVWFGVNL